MNLLLDFATVAEGHLKNTLINNYYKLHYSSMAYQHLLSSLFTGDLQSNECHEYMLLYYDVTTLVQIGPHPPGTFVPTINVVIESGCLELLFNDTDVMSHQHAEPGLHTRAESYPLRLSLA